MSIRLLLHNKTLYLAVVPVVLATGSAAAYIATQHSHTHHLILSTAATRAASINGKPKPTSSTSNPSITMTTDQNSLVANNASATKTTSRSIPSKSIHASPKISAPQTQATSVLGASTTSPNTVTQPIQQTITISSSNTQQAPTCVDPALPSPYVSYATAYPVGYNQYGNIYSTLPLSPGTTITSIDYVCNNGTYEIISVIPFSH